MQDDPVRYWQDLSGNYRQMSDGELLELALKPEDLTEVARQILRDEMRKRGLDEKPAAANVPKKPATPAGIHWEPASYRGAFSPIAEMTEGEHEYTWKVVLAECNSQQEAWQLAEALRRVGIESWIRRSNPFAQSDGNGPAVLVAADELEEARAIADQPIPADIIQESQIQVPEFVAPACPQCGESDPLLESVEPVNTWVCEACGTTWTDPVASAGSE